MSYQKNTAIDVLILARSIKHGGRCIAGRRLEQTGRDTCKIRDWVRPVTQRDNFTGPITIPHNRLPNIFDVMKIPISRPVPNSYQPENILVAHQNWERSFSWTNKLKRHHVVENTEIWPQAINENNDRIPADGFNCGSGSLMIIEPDEIIFLPKKYGDNISVRANFSRGGKNYSLKISDSDFKICYRHAIAKMTPFELSRRKTCPLCLSLTVPFTPSGTTDNFHFLLVATVFDKQLTE